MLPSSGGNSGGDKTFRVKFDFVANTKGAQDAAAAVDQVKKKSEGAGEGIGKTGKQLETLGKASAQVRNVGLAMTAAGAAMTAAMSKSINLYVNNAGTSEQTSRKWLGASKDIEAAQVRIGRALATQTVPYLEKAADLAEKAAGAFEKNPQLAKSAVNVAGGLTIGGGALLAVSGIMKAVETIGKMFGAGGALSGIGKVFSGAASKVGGAGGAALSSPLGVILGGLFAGIGANNLLANTQLGQQAGMQPFNRFLTVGAYGAGKAIGGEEKGLQWASSVGEFTGAIKKAGTESSQAGHEIDYTSQQISAYLSYIRQEQQARRQYNIQVQRMTRDFQRQEQMDLEDYNKSRARSMRDFYRQEALAERDYYRQRAIRARDYGIEVQRAEEDHQREMRRSSEDHQWRLQQIILEGDAYGYWQEQRQYNIDRNRAEEDYQIQASRRSEDFARELADQEREFAIQRERSAEEFKIRMKDEEIDYQIRRKRAQDQFNIQLADLQVNFNEESRQRRQALLDQLRDLQQGLGQERIMRQEFSAAMLADLQSAINAAGQGTNLLAGASTSRASGGYVNGEVVQTHAHEFVLNRPTTEAAEKLAGRQLTQDSVLSMLSGRGGGGVTDNRQFVFNRGFTSEEINAIRSIFREEFEGAYS
jgi:hypothetical protein